MNFKEGIEMKFIAFTIKDSIFALDINTVDSITEKLNLVKTLSDNSCIDGMIHYRNNTMYQVNLCKHFFNLENNLDDRYALVICNINNKEKVALKVDKIDGIIPTNKNNIEMPDNIIKSHNKSIKGFIKDKDNIVQIIDTEYLNRLLENT